MLRVLLGKCLEFCWGSAQSSVGEVLRVLLGKHEGKGAWKDQEPVRV